MRMDYSYVLEILEAVRGDQPIKSIDIIDKTDIPQATVYRYSHELVDRGVLDKEARIYTDPQKRRPNKAQTFSLTDDGKELIEPLKKIVRVMHGGDST